MGFELSFLQGLICCLVYFFAGIVDSISGGGGLLTIPVMLAVGIPVHYITGTNMCSAWVGTGVAAYKFKKSGKMHVKSALITLPFAILGSYLGARLNLTIPDDYLKIFMIAAIPVIAVFLFVNKKVGETNRIGELSVTRIVVSAAVIGVVLGAYLGFYGPGAGIFFMLAYAAFLKLDLVSANGNTRFVIAVAVIGSVITYAFSGVVLWKLVIAATIFNVAGSYLGAVIAIRKGAKVIRPIMFCVLAVLVIKIILDMR